MINKFFDIYSSPLVRILVEKDLINLKSYSCPVDFSSVKRLVIKHEYSTVINGNEIKLFASRELLNKYSEVKFTVNRDFIDAELGPKDRILVTKWLLAQWKDLQTKESKFVCSPYKRDEIDRGSMYIKLGFVYDNASCNYYFN